MIDPKDLVGQETYYWNNIQSPVTFIHVEQVDRYIFRFKGQFLELDLNHIFKLQDLTFFKLNPGHDWPEDFTHENGQYCCKCMYCGGKFTGHKRRIVCKSCSANIED